MTPTFSFSMRSLCLMTCAALCAALFPFSEALATVTSMGTQASHLAKEVVVVPRFIAVMCYVIGTFFAVRGLLTLKDFINDSSDNPITQPLGYLAVSALLIALPYIIEVAQNTLAVNTACIGSTSGSFSDTGSSGGSSGDVSC